YAIRITQYALRSCLHRGGGVEGTAFAGVFALEIGSNHFTLLPAAGAFEGDDGQRAAGENILHLCEIVGVVGHELDAASGDEDAHHGGNELVLDQPPLVVPGFGPWV